MSIFSILAGLLHPIPPSNFTVTDADNQSGTVTKASVALQADARLHLDFEYTIGNTPHVLLGTVDHQGNATIVYDANAETEKPLIHAGTALHFEPLPTPYVIVKWIFQSEGKSQEIRFQGKSSL